MDPGSLAWCAKNCACDQTAQDHNTPTHIRRVVMPKGKDSRQQHLSLPPAAAAAPPPPPRLPLPSSSPTGKLRTAAYDHGTDDVAYAGETRKHTHLIRTLRKDTGHARAMRDHGGQHGGVRCCRA